MLLTICLLFVNLVFANPGAGSLDHYKNFSELAAVNVQGIDYEIEISEFKSPFLVMAFHGGQIEPGTTELARELAKNQYNLYSFIGIKSSERYPDSLTSSDLHLTSAHYDEPQLLGLTKKADFCVALHGFGGGEADFCVGGGNPDQRKKLVKVLKENFPDLRACELCCDPYNGTSKKNPVNMCKNTGVQVEMSPTVRKKILNDPEFKRDLSFTLKQLFPL